MEIDEEVTRTCPTLEEVVAAEETLLDERQQQYQELAQCFVPGSMAQDEIEGPFREIEGHGLGVFPTLMKPVVLDDNQRPIDSTSYPQVRDGCETIVGLTELYQSVSTLLFAFMRWTISPLIVDQPTTILNRACTDLNLTNYNHSASILNFSSMLKRLPQLTHGCFIQCLKSFRAISHYCFPIGVRFLRP
jgi:hypothetical protein